MKTSNRSDDTPSKSEPTFTYWYLISVTECVLCGRQTIERQRIHTVKPRDFKSRHRWQETACNSHFV